MDFITLAFYGIVCGVLGIVSPMLGNPFVRLVVGICVGLAAASILPVIRFIIS